MRQIKQDHHLSYKQIFLDSRFASLEFLSQLNDTMIFHGPDKKEYTLKNILRYQRSHKFKELPDGIVFITNCDRIIHLQYNICLELIFKKQAIDEHRNVYRILYQAA